MRAIRLLRISLRRNFWRVALAAGLSFSRRRRVLAPQADDLMHPTPDRALFDPVN
jgi:hypothetical protein